MNSFNDLLSGWDDPLPKAQPVLVDVPNQIDSSDLVEPVTMPAADTGEQADSASGADEEDSSGEAVGNQLLLTLPADVTTKPTDNNMRRRYDGHSALNDLTRSDWIKAIKLSPDAFDALLYRAYVHQPDSNDFGHTELRADTFDPNQVLLDYQHPEAVVMLDCPDEMDSFVAMYDDSDNAGAGDDALILRTTGLNVPVGSVFEWGEEMTGGRTRRCWWYVQRIFNYGTAKIGSLFYCVPFRSFEGLIDAK